MHMYVLPPSGWASVKNKKSDFDDLLETENGCRLVLDVSPCFYLVVGDWYEAQEVCTYYTCVAT